MLHGHGADGVGDSLKDGVFQYVPQGPNLEHLHDAVLVAGYAEH